MYKRTMVISAEEKKILLARLEKARETKAAKAAAKKKETLADVKSSSANAERCERSVAEPEPPAPVPAPVVAPPPAPAPAPVPEPTPAPPAPPVVPDVPDLVAASKKKPAKKVVESDSDSEDEVVLPPKKGKGKPAKAEKPKYMKIVLYKEPKNAAAFQQLMEAVQDEQPEEEPEVATPPPSSSIGRSCRFANANTNNNSMKKGAGVVSAQEMMRRAAMEFFS